MPRRTNILKYIGLLVLCCLPTLAAPPGVGAKTIEFTDDIGRRVSIEHPPGQVVSLVPSITEIIFALGAGDQVAAVTHHDTWPPEAALKPVVGGYFSPSIDQIASFQPDVIFISDLHAAVIEQFRGTGVKLICLQTHSLSSSFATISRLGEIFHRPDTAREVATRIRDELALIEKKVAAIPPKDRKRVIRLMGRDKVMTPGDDSFQNEIIRAAGGIPPRLGKTGPVVDVSLSEWQAFNPQVIYGCGGDKETAQAFLARPGWREIEAVQMGQIYYFPCNLTCRAATKTGYFTGWLAARVYAAEFAVTQNQVFPDGVFKTRPVAIELPYVHNAQVAYSRINDFVNKTLLVTFKEPQRIVSTLDGQRDNIQTLGNHFAPPPNWAIGHGTGLARLRTETCAALDLSPDTSALLLTGADMDTLVVKREVYRELEIVALVTAGVRSNAMRMSRDRGNYYEPGTINIILLPNQKLSARAMTRAIISATEGKTAALLDMDIRSSYQPGRYRATGTGTDNVMVAAGPETGAGLLNAGGHSKLGELVARAAYAGVQEAVFRQNGLSAKRNIYQRLRERGITPNGLVALTDCACGRPKSRISSSLEEILGNPRYSAFLETALALSDDYEKGLLKELSMYKQWCQGVAADIAGQRLATLKHYPETETLPTVLKLALNALLNGVYHQNSARGD